MEGENLFVFVKRVKRCALYLMLYWFKESRVAREPTNIFAEYKFCYRF